MYKISLLRNNFQYTILKGVAGKKGRRQGLMGIKIKMGLLICLAATAVLTLQGAYRSMRLSSSATVPEELYARFSSGERAAEYYLRACDGYVAVYADGRARSPVTVTDIETSQLRRTDRALLDNGIPVTDRRELLFLLEDLGS